MRIAEVIGSVVLNRCHPSLIGAQLKLSVPLSSENLQQGTKPSGEELLVVYDPLGAGIGNRIAMSEGGEAAQPFRPELVPVDAYNAAILDEIDVRKS